MTLEQLLAVIGQLYVQLLVLQKENAELKGKLPTPDKPE